MQNNSWKKVQVRILGNPHLSLSSEELFIGKENLHSWISSHGYIVLHQLS